MSIFFSIVVPLYNKEKYIQKTLDSVLRQTYRNFELLVIDDGSTDGSVELVRTYTDERIKLFSQKNAGVSAARNKGISKSTYDHIALLDADDWWGADYLENMKDLILKYPSVNMYALEYFRVFNGRVIPSMRVLDPEITDGLINPLVYGIQNGALPLHTSSVVIRKSILERTGLFDERISFFEDYDLFLRIISFGKIAYGTKGSAHYNIDVSPNEKLTGRLPPIDRNFISYTEKLEPFYKKNDLMKVFVDRFMIMSLIAHHRTGNFKAAVRELSSKVPSNSYEMKDKLLLFLPSPFADFIVKMKIRINGIMKKDLD